jgi:hypothetical protein
LLWLVPLDRHDQLFLQVDSLSFHLVQKSPVTSEALRRNQRSEVEQWDSMWGFGNALGGTKTKKDSLGLPIIEDVDDSNPQT